MLKGLLFCILFIYITQSKTRHNQNKHIRRLQPVSKGASKGIESGKAGPAGGGVSGKGVVAVSSEPKGGASVVSSEPKGVGSPKASGKGESAGLGAKGSHGGFISESTPKAADSKGGKGP